MLVLSVCLSSSFNEVFNPKSIVERHAFIPQSFVVSETTKTTPPSEEINEEDRDKESDKAIENETMQQLKRQVLVTLENEEKVIDCCDVDILGDVGGRRGLFRGGGVINSNIDTTTQRYPMPMN